MPAFCPNEPSQCPGPSPAVSEPFTEAACLSLIFYLLYYLHLGFSKIVFATLWLYILYLG